MAIDKDVIKKALREIRDEDAAEEKRKKDERDSLKKELRKEVLDDLLKEDDPDPDAHEFEV